MKEIVMKFCDCPSHTTPSSCMGPKDGDTCRAKPRRNPAPTQAQLRSAAAQFGPLDEPLVALGEIVSWWQSLPSRLRQDIEGSGAEPGAIAKARRLTTPPAPPEEEVEPERVADRVRNIAEALYRASPERIDAVVQAVQKLEHRAELRLRFMTEDEIVEDIVAEIKRAGSEAVQAWKGAKFDELIRLHHSVGQNIRNQFGLWEEDNPNVKHNPEPNEHGIVDDPLFPDQVSQRIIERVWKVIAALPAVAV